MDVDVVSPTVDVEVIETAVLTPNVPLLLTMEETVHHPEIFPTPTDNRREAAPTRLHTAHRQEVLNRLPTKSVSVVTNLDTSPSTAEFRPLQRMEAVNAHRHPGLKGRPIGQTIEA